MAAVLHRIEALAGEGRYAVTFQRTDRSEQAAVVQVVGEGISTAEASLPDGWTSDSAPYKAMADAVVAFHSARGVGPTHSALVDVDGGWDVMMGNVVLGESNVPTCTAHGPMQPDSSHRWRCEECGAAAGYAA